LTEEQTIEVLASLRSINSALCAIALMLVKQANPVVAALPSFNPVRISAHVRP
jgi:hypothetical protein